MDFLLAFVAGLLTLINPCVLPVLPIIIAGALGDNKFAPVAIVAGLCLTFTVVGITVAAIGPSLGISEDSVSRTSAAALVLLGAIMLVPTNFFGVSALNNVAVLANNWMAQLPTQGLFNQFLGGCLLGAAWAPCIGPTLGGAIALAYEQSSIPYAAVIMLIFSLGAGTIMLTIAYGTKSFVSRFNSVLRVLSAYSKVILGVTFITIGLAIYFRFHYIIEAKLLDIMPEFILELSTRF